MQGRRTPPPAAQVAPSQSTLTFDDELEAIAALAPGFSGMFFHDGVLIVRKTAAASDEALQSAILAADQDARFRGVTAAVQAGRVAFEIADFDFPTLRRWARSVMPELVSPAIQSFDIDERAGQLQVGVLDHRAADAARTLFAAHGVPETAVSISIEEPIRYQTDLDDYLRPIPAGMKTNGCTVGVNALADGEDQGFLTAAHCTNDWGGYPDGTYFYQPNAGSNYIGMEWADGDLGAYRSDPNCPSPYLCRYADAAMIGYDDPDYAQQGTIARTTGLGSTTISSSHPRFLLNDPPITAPIVGTDLNVVGMAGGWTQGEVTATCVWIPGPETNTGLLCQWKADYDTQNGDSGAPVFTWDEESAYVDLVGIHSAASGSYRYFSRWSHVLFELEFKIGTLDVAY